jgi:hypothetical protein
VEGWKGWGQRKGRRTNEKNEIKTKTNRKREKCGTKKLLIINEGRENHIEDGTSSAVRRTDPRPAGGSKEGPISDPIISRV